MNDAAGDDAFDFASRAAATVAAVTGLDIAGSLSDEAFADAANDPDSVLDATEKADLKDLYEKVLAALKGAGYKMKEDGDKVVIDPAATGDEAGEAGGSDGEAAAGSDGKAAGGSDGKAAAGSDGGDEEVIYDDDEKLGDPLDQTIDKPHEYHPTPTTLNGMNQPILTPVVPTTPKPSKPKPTKPSPTPVGLR